MSKPIEYGRPWWEVMKEVAAQNETLKAEVERLTWLQVETLNERNKAEAEVERLRASSFVTAVPSEDYEKLKAEVERLRKAGDAMAEALNLNDDVFDNQEKKEAQAAWNAAKEDSSQ